jgi:outer membrane protein assembly factor BamB
MLKRSFIALVLSTFALLYLTSCAGSQTEINQGDLAPSEDVSTDETASRPDAAPTQPPAATMTPSPSPQPEEQITALPMYRGNIQRTGQFDATGVTGTGSLKWQFETGDEVHSSPAVSDGVLYVASYDGNLYAIDTESGQALWQSEVGRTFSSPLVVDESIFVGSADGLHALDRASGAERWYYKAQVGGEMRSSPAFFEGLVYIGSDDGNLYAFEAQSGDLAWQFKTLGQVFSSPAIYKDMVYAGDYAGYLHALDAASGEELWQYKTGRSVYATPAIKNGMVFFGSLDGNFYALDAASGEELWVTEIGEPIVSSAALSQGSVYFGCLDHNVYALDATSGKVIWQFETSNEVYSSPALANGMLYIGSDDTHLYALDAKTGKPRWNHKTGGFIGNSPAVAGNMVFFTSYDGSIYAIGSGEPDTQ